MERSDVRLDWAFSGLEFDLFASNLTDTHITMEGWRRMIRENDLRLWNYLEKLLPSGYPVATMNNLPWETLSAEGTREEFFIDVAMKGSWLREAIEGLRDAYLDPLDERHKIMTDGTPSISAFKSLLSLDAIYQQTMVGCH